VAEVLVSSVDKKHDVDEPSISLCNYTHVYYNRYLTKFVNYDKGTASNSEIERFQLRKWDVVITKDSEEANDIGVSACVTEDIESLVCGYHLAIIRPQKDLVDSVYLSSLFSLHETRKHFAIQSNGVTRFGLPVKSIESLRLNLPSIREQREIATLIRQLDHEQLLNAHRLELLKRERAALGQQILTGQSRISDSVSARARTP
jgi:type I restriction enzyme S subunit